MSVKIGIIGGSGLYKMGIIDDRQEQSVDTPFGKPSDKITLGTIDGIEIAFLPRHGKSHTLAPHKVNYRANIFAFKELGVEYLISTAAVGSLKKELKPCDFVIADQLIDRSFKRSTTFFDEGIVAHVGFADPFCNTLSDLAFDVASSEGVRVHHGSYICIEGPQFSTRAESNLYRSWDVDVVGMTLAPEAKLAREAEMCLCGILTVTDYDCWYEGEKDVSVASVVENLKKNDTNIANIIKKFIPKIRYTRTCHCHSALEYGILTSPELLKKNADPRVAKVLLKRFIK
ncbi:MAG TPA: S-methyl-5'-thioadenosine phosphorylase [Candidatus Thermoplasmatota archaeon]|nr:S-methyl-5'-thioadenosine phosphorylase [Candidatus Thermoplasmatota archaeon]